MLRRNGLCCKRRLEYFFICTSEDASNVIEPRAEGLAIHWCYFVLAVSLFDLVVIDRSRKYFVLSQNGSGTS